MTTGKMQNDSLKTITLKFYDSMNCYNNKMTSSVHYTLGIAGAIKYRYASSDDFAFLTHHVGTAEANFLRVDKALGPIIH